MGGAGLCTGIRWLVFAEAHSKEVKRSDKEIGGIAMRNACVGGLPLQWAQGIFRELAFF